MIKNTFLAFIPARGGSKRLPNKNILPLAGKPLVAWTIEAAKGSKYIDDIILSTDDDKILHIGKDYGIKIVKRPDFLSTDGAKTEDVILYHLQSFQKIPEFIVLLQPTSPLRKSRHIDEAIDLLKNKKADAVISVSEVDHPVEWCNIIPEDKNLKNFINKEIFGKRSQDMTKRYRLNGAIYIIKTMKLIEKKTFFIDDNIYAYIMDKLSSVDIDDEFDFKFAESLISDNYSSL